MLMEQVDDPTLTCRTTSAPFHGPDTPTEDSTNQNLCSIKLSIFMFHDMDQVH
jgi:hypothetical protein